MRLRIFILLAAVLLQLPLAAQTTKVHGRVLDSTDGQPVPFAGVFFVGTDIGVSTDINGEFSLTTRDQSLKLLRVSMLSYDPQDREIKPGTYNAVDIFLHPQDNTLNAVTVKADNHKARRLLANIDAHRSRNNPEDKPGYKCDVYSKMELDLTNPREQLHGKLLDKQWSFVFDYVDTSDVSGIPYLPVMINESVTKRYHSTNPDVDRETILANRLSGAKPEGNLVAQFTGSMHLKNNFYSQFINAFNVEIPSPTNSGGLLFYNYYIIDSLQMDGRKTLRVRYHPKPAISTPAFDGEMLIDAEDFALRRLKARMVKGQNINWVRDMAFEAEYVRKDSTWFYKSDRFYADFSVTAADSSKMMSFIGNRTLEFSNPEFVKEEVDASKTLVTVVPDAGMKDEQYWDNARPYDLTQKEKNIYKMVEQVQDTRLYNTLYDVVYTIINGYWEHGNFAYGPYHKIFSFNPLEGFRLRLGGRTSIDWSQKDRFTGYLAYGFRDKEFKGGLMWEHMFSKTPTGKLTLDGHYDVLQLSRGTNKFNDGNILASVMGAGKTQKLCPIMEFSALYDHEFTGNFNTQFQTMFRQYYGNSFVPMVTPQGDWVRHYQNISARVMLRLSRDETVTRGYYIKTYTHTNYPVFTLDLEGGAANLSGMHPYFRPELNVDWTFRIPPVGMSKLHVNAGTVVGRVPYQLLHLHEGNGTFLLDKSSFSCMDFFEFASDSWGTVMWDHNFYGFFLGKIPYVKKLKMREAVTVKATWGYLSPRNDGTRATGESAVASGASSAMLMFPEGMHSLGKVPYVEAGFAITNILQLFRVDFIWRVTHRDDVRQNPRNFVVNFGVELRF